MIAISRRKFNMNPSAGAKIGARKGPVLDSPCGPC